jgi:hypothetical protein
MYSEGKGKYTQIQLKEEFQKVFDKCLHDLRSMKDALEKSNREACLSQIAAYAVYHQLSASVSAEICAYIGEKSHLHADRIFGQMFSNGFIYRRQTVLTSDQRLTHDDYEWRFFRHTL